jgi:predicted  nucleic acid-binding Zn-ribbon protein
MATSTRIQRRITRIEARLEVIEQTYDGIAKIASYRHNYGEVDTTYQQFRDVAAEYWRLLDELDRLEAQLEVLNGEPGDSSGVAVVVPQ